MRQNYYSLIFSMFLMLIFLVASWLAYSFNDLAKFFPYTIAIGGAILTFIHVILSIVKMVKGENASNEEQHEEEGSVLRYMLWIIGYIGLIYIIGFLTATTLFLAFFLYFESKFSVLKTAISLAIVLSLIHIFANMMNLYWPEGVFPLWPF
ncbi:tripartite tricarboxylate transporter TctB family protein [Salirhabdus salicampi]|uniref:tripartite tricarboxylate transporter TctB family protein n=1 Tax=Salirhabdus salicampi TaxID=476102 RepID=UPI0020C3CC69|nr:tripartite tricarboxylate transporter TctB family protein [Salirhabdus salicampi]MCP8616317.1 tripartite tricarboxylate transporter TctB family protein [Salirhabdus salicampi]